MIDKLPWMVLAYAFFCVIGATLLMYVMVKYEDYQQRNKTDSDPPWLRLARKISFFVSASLLLLSAAAYELWVISIPVIILVAANDTLLAFNAISLHRRTPPGEKGGRAEDMYWRGLQPPTQFGHYISRADVERLDRGQKYTHDILEAILMNLEMEPESAIIDPNHDPNKAIVYPPQFRPRGPL